MASQERLPVPIPSNLRRRPESRGLSRTRRLKRLALRLRQLCDVPATPERLHQQDTGVHSASEAADVVALVHEGHRLGDDDLKVAVRSALVAIREQLKREL